MPGREISKILVFKTRELELAIEIERVVELSCLEFEEIIVKVNAFDHILGWMDWNGERLPIANINEIMGFEFDMENDWFEELLVIELYNRFRVGLIVEKVVGILDIRRLMLDESIFYFSVRGDNGRWRNMEGMSFKKISPNGDRREIYLPNYEKLISIGSLLSCV